MKPESSEEKVEPTESAPPPEERGQVHVETPLPEHLTEEVVERTIDPVAQALDHEAVSWLVKNDLVDAAEKRHSGLAKRVQQPGRRNAMIAGGVILLLVSFLIPVDPPHVSIGAEPILAGGPKWLTNSLIHTFIVDIILIVMALAATRSMKVIPSGFQNFMEMVVEYLYDFCESIAGHNARRFSQWALTLFLFIVISNWTGLIPGVGSIGFYHLGESHGEEIHEGETHEEEVPAEEHEEGANDEGSMMDVVPMADNDAILAGQIAMADGKALIVEPGAAAASPSAATEGGHKFVPLLRPPSADLNFTFAIALITMVMVQVYGFQALGASYFTKFFNLNGTGAMKGVNLFVSILELISELSRILTFAFRLFGNIFAGEVVLATMAFLVTFLIPVPFYFLEIFVGFVQSLVFMALALIFFTVATISHHEEEHH